VTVAIINCAFVEDDEAQDELKKTMVIQPSARPVEKLQTARAAAETSLARSIGHRHTAFARWRNGLEKSQIASSLGAFAGRELELSKALTTLGRPGLQVAAITRRSEGYFIVHVDSGKDGDYPLVNGVPISAQARKLSDNDVIQLAG